MFLASFPPYHSLRVGFQCQDHRDVRAHDGAIGKMVGASLHLTMRGVFEHYKDATVSSKNKRKQGAEANHTAAMLGACQAAWHFFEGRGVGYEEFAAHVGRPLHAVSRNLGNPSHLDVYDASPGYAWWVRARPELPEPHAWWFLFVDVGLAIRLVDGCAMSWDGRYVRHCSACPLGISEGDELLSVWKGSKQTAEAAMVRQREMREALRVREQCAEVRGMAWRVDDPVWVKWTADGERMAGSLWRRVTGAVEQVLPGGELVVSWPDCGFAPDHLDAKTVRERVVHAGVVGPQPTHLGGLLLVGHRIRIWWPHLRGRGEDCIFSGSVTAYDAELAAHRVLYDDGVVEWEVLGGPFAPRYCLE